MSFQLNDQQSEAIRKAIKWYYDPHKKPIFVLSGFAGSGKSSCCRMMTELMGVSKYQILWATLSGKAACVLRAKGNYANTIHSTFYRVCTDPETGKTFFAKRKSVNGCIKLIVIDEASMVDGKMMEDLISFKIPILLLGDPGQLPPLFNPNPYMEHPDIILTKVMRQSGDSGILKLATMARNNEELKFGNYIESKVIHINEIKDIEKYDMVLCWSNRRRRELNKFIRHAKGYDKFGNYPIKGEKIMCLRNDLDRELIYYDISLNPMNGMIMEVLEDSTDYDKYTEFIDINARPDFIEHKDNLFFNMRCPKLPFDKYYIGDNSIDTEELDMFTIPREYTINTFAYACSVHKSQGSQWENVLIIDDYKGRKDQYSNWIYTALTRASKSVVLAKE